jgi:CheY-like chemotaxis protein
MSKVSHPGPEDPARGCDEPGGPTDPAGARRPVVLVADDEEGVRGVVELTLRREGFEVLLAAGGQQAVELYRQRGADVDLVLLDVQMPGLDGPWTLIALQTVNPAVRCCFMSGSTGDYDAEVLQAIGAVRVFAKPFEPGTLVQGLRDVLDGM